ncbi:MAG: hypothetical protein NC203_07150 [Firmicutes bacterium]|nr:hypothetical protein [[Eubacterium] siraeum]MCM1488126.1 hypothetical protein [Bacillota bacterium]
MKFGKTMINSLKALFLACLMLLSCACANTAEIDFSDEETAQKFAQMHGKLYQALENAETDDERAVQITPEELKAADLTDCTVSVIDGIKIFESLTEEETKEFAEMIANADINGDESDMEYPKRAGVTPSKQFQITFSSGDFLFIGETPILEREDDYDPNGNNYYFVINGEHLYQCDKETTIKMSDYWDKAYWEFENYVRAAYVQDQKSKGSVMQSHLHNKEENKCKLSENCRSRLL